MLYKHLVLFPSLFSKPRIDPAAHTIKGWTPNVCFLKVTEVQPGFAHSFWNPFQIQEQSVFPPPRVSLLSSSSREAVDEWQGQLYTIRWPQIAD